MRRLQRAQALDDIQDLKRERNGQTGESFFFATCQGALSARFCERAAVFGEQGMAEEWMTSFRCGLPPKPWWPAEQNGAIDLPVLKQVDQRILVIKLKQSPVEG